METDYCLKVGQKKVCQKSEIDVKKTKVFLNIDVFVFAPCAGTAKQPSSIPLKRNDPRRESNKGATREPPRSHRGAHFWFQWPQGCSRNNYTGAKPQSVVSSYF